MKIIIVDMEQGESHTIRPHGRGMFLWYRGEDQDPVTMHGVEIEVLTTILANIDSMHYLVVRYPG